MHTKTEEAWRRQRDRGWSWWTLWAGHASFEQLQSAGPALGRRAAFALRDGDEAGGWNWLGTCGKRWETLPGVCVCVVKLWTLPEGGPPKLVVLPLGSL